MPEVHKTKALAATAAAAFPFCFVDPTGTAQMVFLTTSTGVGFGLTAHLGRSIWRKAHKLRSSKRAQTEGNVDFTSDSDHELVAFDQRAFEECIRKLAASMTGIVVSGTLSIVLPHYVVGFLLSGGEVAYHLRRLRKMRDLCGGTKQLMENVSNFDVALQVSTGVCIRFLTTILFLGAADFNTFVDSIADACDGLMTLGNGATEGADALKAAHDSLLDHHLFSASTALAGAPSESLSQVLGDGTNYTPTWTDGAPTGYWAGIGVANTVAETGLARMVEEPVHKAINVASTAGEKVAFPKQGHEQRKSEDSDQLTPRKKRFSMFRGSSSPTPISSY
jgi:hypothetical protein